MLLRFLLALLLTVGSAGAARALPVTLTLVPSTLALLPGQFVSVDVVIGGLTELVDEEPQEIALEFFDLELSFDPAYLQFDSLSFGGSLGTVAQTFRTGPGTPNVTGVVEMGNFSFLTEVQLLALQAAPFVLTTITFEALENPGGSLLALIGLVDDSLGSVGGRTLGDELAAPASLEIEVLPEPAAAGLFAAALALLGLRLRAQRA
jgi:hypothetical protein